MTVADRIKLRREELNMTQDELAAKMGYSSKSAVSRTENAGDNIGQKRIIAFAKALETTPSYLMGWESDTKTELVSEDGHPVRIVSLDEFIFRDDSELLEFVKKGGQIYMEEGGAERFKTIQSIIDQYSHLIPEDKEIIYKIIKTDLERSNNNA